MGATTADFGRAAHEPGVVRRSLDALPRGSDALLLAAVLALLAGLLAYLPGAFSVDSWLALVAGRDIWQTGVPHHETLTVLAHGGSWIDQQWLAQLVTYGLYKLGGLGLLGLVNMVLVAAAVGGAILGARRLGAKPLAVMVLLPLCVWLIVPSREVRTQEFAMPLFVLLAYLLATDSRRHTRRVYWCLPLLILWANLHGSAAIATGLVALRGLTLVSERRHRLLHEPAQWRGPLLLTLGAPLCLLVTPYGLDTLSYYHATLFNSSLKSAVTEWQAITSEPAIAAPFFLLAGLSIWSFGRQPSSTTLWERLALIALAAVSISVIRNVLFFALAALLIVPVAFSPIIAARTRAEVKLRPRVNSLALLVVALALLIATAATLVRPQSRLQTSEQRPGVLAAVRSAMREDPSIRVLADVRFADWLLWEDPALRGHVVNDARFELLTGRQLARIRDVFAALGTNWKLGARGDRLIVIDRKYAPDGARGLLAEPGRRVLYNDGERLVILRSAQQADAGIAAS